MAAVLPKWRALSKLDRFIAKLPDDMFDLNEWEFISSRPACAFGVACYAGPLKKCYAKSGVAVGTDGDMRLTSNWEKIRLFKAAGLMFGLTELQATDLFASAMGSKFDKKKHLHDHKKMFNRRLRKHAQEWLDANP